MLLDSPDIHKMLVKAAYDYADKETSQQPTPSVAVKALTGIIQATGYERLNGKTGKSEFLIDGHTFTADQIRSALSAQVQDVAGWQLVPIEPTQEMLDACGPKPKHWDATPSSRRVRESADHMRREDYKTMLAAAPAKQEG